LPVDRDAAPLHAREHANERPLQGLIHTGDLLGRKPRLERAPQPQRHVGVLGRVFGCLVDVDVVERNLGFARPGHVLERDRFVAEQFLRQFVHAVAGLAGIEHVGHQHRVVIGAGIDAAPAEDQPVEFEIVSHFQDAQILEQRLDQFEGRLLGDLIIDDCSREQTVASNTPFAMD
jgi:hypothetical protein